MMSYCSIVFQFQNEIDFDGPFMTDSELRLKLKGTITELEQICRIHKHSFLGAA